MLLDGPGHFLADVRAHKLGAPIAVIGADEAAIGDVVQQAGDDDLLVVAAIERQLGALQEVVVGDLAEAVAEEIEQGRLVRHLFEPGRVAHHEHRVRVHLRQHFALQCAVIGGHGDGRRQRHAALAGLRIGVVVVSHVQSCRSMRGHRDHGKLRPRLLEKTGWQIIPRAPRSSV